MVINWKKLGSIQFPIFALPSSNWEERDGLLFVDNRIVDDKNMTGKTLGMRRLQTPMKDLLPLRGSIAAPISLVRQQRIKNFIDNKGTPFIYEKTTWSSLKYYKIRKVERKDIASVLWLKGVSFPFKVPRPPEESLSWAGVLHVGDIPWILYEYSETKQPDTRRKV